MDVVLRDSVKVDSGDAHGAVSRRTAQLAGCVDRCFDLVEGRLEARQPTG